MDYLMFIDRIAQSQPMAPKVQFLVSGNDSLIRNAAFENVVCKCREKEELLIIIDDTDATNTVDLTAVNALGYQVINGMSGEYCLYQPFKITTLSGISKIRQLLSTLGYNEQQKGKLISYLNFIRHIEYLESGSHELELTLDKLGEYCTTMAVEEKLQALVDTGCIDARQQMMLLSKYAECASAAADFEDMFFVLLPFIKGDSVYQDHSSRQALIFRTGQLGEDETVRSLIMQLLQFGLEERCGRKATLVIFDKGYGSRKCVLNLIKSLPAYVDMHIFSEDIFTLCDAETLAMVLNRFAARIYSRHLAMSSAAAIEKVCGEIDVIKSSQCVTYDRRWRANSPLDMLFGTNKTEAYTQMAPVREPRYRKEMIMGFPPGNGIVDFMGNTTIFAV